MSQTIADLTITPNAWVDVFSITGIPQSSPLLLQNKSGRTHIDYVISDTEPALDYGFGGVIAKYPDNPAGMLISTAGSKLWLKTHEINAIVSVEDGTTTLTIRGGYPDGVFEGLRAMTVQFYPEANAKAGVQHEGSTLLTLAGEASNDTIFLTGALPVSLKGRVIGYSGEGLTAEIYETPTYSGGTTATYQNASAINPAAGLSTIIVGATVTNDGTLKFAPDHLIGNTSVQGKGNTGTVSERERLLKPNTAYLFKITSLDTQPQRVSSLLTWYEGELDLPRP